MKFTFFTFKKDNAPKPTSLRPSVFRTDLFWFLSLGLFAIILVITGTIGFRLFYEGYFESYKQEIPKDTFENLINIDRLKTTIEKRSDFINQKISLPNDPSFW